MPMKPEDRIRLSELVDKEFWGGKRGLKDELEDIAEVAYANCLKKLWEEGKATKEAVRKCAEEADLKAKYKEFWGKE